MAELALNPTGRASRSSHRYLAETATPGRKADYVALPGTTCSVLNCKAIVEELVPQYHTFTDGPHRQSSVAGGDGASWPQTIICGKIGLVNK